MFSAMASFSAAADSRSTRAAVISPSADLTSALALFTAVRASLSAFSAALRRESRSFANDSISFLRLAAAVAAVAFFSSAAAPASLAAARSASSFATFSPSWCDSDPSHFCLMRPSACSAWSSAASSLADALAFAAHCFSLDSTSSSDVLAASSADSAEWRAWSLARTELPLLRDPPVSKPPGLSRSPSTVTQLVRTSLSNATARAVAASLHTKALPNTYAITASTSASQVTRDSASLASP
mmetsp:Transcript_10364/g.44980  ORF Transcript_10364/g.44980 Transcript_10364/m.44980 type:complete len:241 (+) Transcript_10364:113-835(+)